jgi:hypothetical protein
MEYLLFHKVAVDHLPTTHTTITAPGNNTTAPPVQRTQGSGLVYSNDLLS